MNLGHLSPALVVVAICWILLGSAHSILGERRVLQPLFREPTWRLGGIPRGWSERLLRFAWHLTSVTWLGLAGIALGLPTEWCLMAVALVAGVCGFAALRAHLAWPIFLLASFATAWSVGLLDRALRPVGFLTVAVLALLGLVHVYWAFGGRRGRDSALPTAADGGVVFRPGRALTFAVAAVLFGYAGLVGRALYVDDSRLGAVVGAGALVLAARAVGDGRYCGFTKRVRNTAFARFDDRFFTPVVVFLALGSVGVLLA